MGDYAHSVVLRLNCRILQLWNRSRERMNWVFEASDRGGRAAAIVILHIQSWELRCVKPFANLAAALPLAPRRVISAPRIIHRPPSIRDVRTVIYQLLLGHFPFRDVFLGGRARAELC